MIMSAFSGRRNCRALAAVVVGVGALVIASPSSAQLISLKELIRPPEIVPAEQVHPDLIMAFSCATSPSNYPPTLDQARMQAEFARAMRGTPSAGPRTLYPFLLAPPYACTPNADRLLSRSLDELTGVGFEEFLALTKLPKMDRAQRTGIYEARKEFDRREAALPGKIAAVQQLIAQHRLEEAHDAIDAAFPGKQFEVVLGLARYLLLADDENLNAYGRRCLERSADTVNLPRLVEVGLLFGHLAFRERRWTDARLHYQRVAELSYGLHGITTEQELTRLYKELYIAMAAVAEQRGNFSQALNEIDSCLAVDPHDPLPYLHKAVMMFFKEQSDSGDAEALNFFREARDLADKDKRAGRSSIETPLPEVAILSLYPHATYYRRKPVDVAARWAEILGRNDDWQKDPRERARVFLVAAQAHFTLGRLQQAEELLQKAIDSDPAEAARTTAIRNEILFHMRSPAALPGLTQAFLADPEDRDSARMLAISLLDSENTAEKIRGAKLAAMLHRAHPNSRSLAVAAAYADHLTGQDDRAFETAKKSWNERFETGESISDDDVYLLALIFVRSADDKTGERLNAGIRILEQLDLRENRPFRYRDDAVRLLAGLQRMPRAPFSTPTIGDFYFPEVIPLRGVPSAGPSPLGLDLSR